MLLAKTFVHALHAGGVYPENQSQAQSVWLQAVSSAVPCRARKFIVPMQAERFGGAGGAVLPRPRHFADVCSAFKQVSWSFPRLKGRDGSASEVLS